MNIKKLPALILTAILFVSCFSACAPKETSSASSHIHTQSEHTHDEDTTSGTASENQSEDKNTSSKANAGVQRPDKAGSDEDNQTDKATELSDEGHVTSQKLFEDIEKISPKSVKFFRVKNTTYASTSYVAYDTLSKNLNPFNTIKDKNTIQHLKDALEYLTWTPKKFTANTMPSIVIYFDDKIHLNIESEVNGVYWMSLNADYGKVYYVVPENVYENVMAFCYELEK